MALEIKWIGGACIILKIGKLKIAIDPVLCPKGRVQDYFWFKSTRLESPSYDIDDFEGIDLWLITHSHEDHLDAEGLSKIKKGTPLICNVNSAKKLKKRSHDNLTVLKTGEHRSIQLKEYKLEIEAIPAIHGVNPLSALVAGHVNGYYLTISKGDSIISIYITGDTVYKRRVIRAMAGKPIDLLIANMGAAQQGSWMMSLTMNSTMLKKMMAVLHPRAVVPVHFGTFSHYKEPKEKIIEIGDERIRILAVGERALFKFD